MLSLTDTFTDMTTPALITLQQRVQACTTDQDVANACLFLASDVSRQLTGVDLPVDGGWVADASWDALRLKKR